MAPKSAGPALLRISLPRTFVISCVKAGNPEDVSLNQNKGQPLPKING